MNTIKIKFSITKLIIVFLISFLFCEANLFADIHDISEANGIGTWGEVKKLTASDAEAYDNFGSSVAVAGDVIVVGAIGASIGTTDSGVAYVFERNAGGNNVWGQVKKLVASDAESYDEFGYSVAVHGDVAVVGAYGKDFIGYDSGAAYVFEQNAGSTNVWREIKKLTAGDAEGGDYFGFSVAVANDVAIAGAPYENAGGSGAGAAYLFERNFGGNNAWGEVKKLTASDAKTNDEFGFSADVDGEVAIVGAYYKETHDIYGGAAYIFERNMGGTNVWGEVKKLTANDMEDGDDFGYSTAVDGDVAVVGARAENAGGSDAGAAYIFERNAGGSNSWAQVKKLTASDAEQYDEFGYSVAVAGDVIVIGAYSKYYSRGVTYVFERNSGGSNAWGETEKLTASDAQVSDYFGYSVAVEEDVTVAGAINESTGGSSAGAAYVFENFINSPPQIATNALIFPSAGATILAPFPTNIIWNFEKITDFIDGTNVTITKISVHISETTNEVSIVTNNIENLLGEIPWFVPENLIGSDTNYVLKFEVVDSSLLTNSRIFWDNKFTIIPEPFLFFMIVSLIIISAFR